MPDCMMPFPEDWHDFLKDYSFDDSQEVYTNGSRLIPVFRVEQLIKHLLKAQESVKPILTRGWYLCGGIGCRNSLTSALENDIPARKPNYCERCGRKVKWDAQEQRDYEAAVEMAEYCERYEPTYNADDGSM